jgi:predicted aldo/keto reductase-like oxidoreductase
MEKRVLGRTGWEVTAISFGAIKLPRASQRECTEVLNRALDLGINFVDTADCYGDSEEKIGNALKHRRSEFYLATKVDQRDAKGARKTLERSLKRLQCDTIDLIQFHDCGGSGYDRAMAPGGVLEEMKRAQAEGKVVEIGITVHSNIDTMRKAIESGEFATIMVAFNLLDRERVGSEVIPSAHEHGMGVICMKPLAGGRLADDRELTRLKEGEMSLAQLALQFILSSDMVTCAIPGMTRVSELEQNIKVAQEFRKLSIQEIRELVERVGDVGRDFCRNCGYCLPCPQDINIPDVFRFEGYYTRYGMKQWAMKQYAALDVKVEECAECEQCIEKCPYGLDIPRLLKRAAEVLTA